jgi:hypothetical protein
MPWVGRSRWWRWLSWRGSLSEDMRRAVDIVLGAALFLFNALMNGPLFMTGEMPFRGSIEGGYAGMARFISAHPNPWGWDPQQYCGLPTQFLYLPGLPYVTAALVHLVPGAQAADVYRILEGILTCLAPVSLFVFVLYFTRSRLWGLLAALAYSIFSPAYGLLPHLLKDLGQVELPWRTQVLVKYGEGPHTMGLALLPLALIAVSVAGRERRYRQIFVAALLLAAIVLTNWIAGLSLAFCCLLFLLAGLPAKPVLAAGALGYLLAGFWLTPSFVQTVAFNWPVDSFGYQVKSPQKLLLAGLIASALVIRLLFLRFPKREYLCFVTMGAFVFGWIAVIFSMFGFDTIPESRRYAPEFEMFLILALAEWFRTALASPNSTVRFCAIGPGAIMLLMGAPQAWGFLTQGWANWKPMPTQETIEYRAAAWLARQNLTGRVLASGGLRYRLNSWFDIPQAGGAWESGLTNRTPVDLAFQVRSGIGSTPGHRLDDAMIEMKAMAVEYLVIHGPQSREYYRDFASPGDFAGLPVAWHEQDDTIYTVVQPSLAHVVFAAELPKYRVPWAMASLAAAVDDPARPRLTAAWQDQNTLRITGAILPQALVYVHVSHHPGWRATQDGRPVTIERDNLGFMIVRAGATAQSTIELHYGGTTEQRVMAAISALAWMAALAALFRRRGRQRAPAVRNDPATSCT